MAGSALAAVFPDVPAGHLYREPIEKLVEAGVITGNPDGTFEPGESVNRAAFLKMLYLAQGKQPDPSSVQCFTDVVPDSWYEPFVCDAAANGYVNGYPDRTFRPGQKVNRVEALKMIMLLFDIPVPEISAADKDVVKFVDVSTAAWYTKYLYTAFAAGVLPIAGQDGSRFHPDRELLRGEAAAYIYNALHAELKEMRREQSPSSASSSSSSSAVSEENGEEEEESARPQDGSLSVGFPFEHSGKFEGKRPFSYVFDISEPATVYTDVQLNAAGKVSCRLYLLAESGFSDEYFLGHQEGAGCELHTTLNTGRYQLQLQPTVADSTYTVSAAVKQGDGNDGFRDAARLYQSTPRTEFLEKEDLQDWFMFVVPEEKTMTVEITNAPEMDCIIYAMGDVDLFGFSGPECNRSYLFPPGTYYVAVGRSVASKTTRKTYTIQVR